MITSFRHKGLRIFWEKDDRSKLPSTAVGKIDRILGIIDNLEKVPDDLQDIIVKILRPHQLQGNLKGFWALDVTGNWRIIFKFDNNTKEATDIDLIDYH